MFLYCTYNEELKTVLGKNYFKMPVQWGWWLYSWFNFFLRNLIMYLLIYINNKWNNWIRYVVCLCFLIEMWKSFIPRKLQDTFETGKSFFFLISSSWDSSWFWSKLDLSSVWRTVIDELKELHMVYREFTHAVRVL